MRLVYAHLGTIRHRFDAVEYRAEQHLERLGDRLQRLGLGRPSVTGSDTADSRVPETQLPHQHLSASWADASDLWAWS